MSKRDQLPELRDYAGYADQVDAEADRLSARLAGRADGASGVARRSWAPLALALAAAVLVAIVSWQIWQPGEAPHEVIAAPESPELLEVPGLNAPLTIELPAAAEGQLALAARMDPPVIHQSVGEEQFLAIACEAPALDSEPVPIHLAAVVDTSGSMAEGEKDLLARIAMLEVVATLRPEDTFSVVTFNASELLLYPAQPVDGTFVLDHDAEALSPGGTTRIAAGLRAALAHLASVEGEGVKRALLLSDGLSPEAREDVAAAAASRREEGISVSAVGLGEDRDDFLLKAISAAGGGRYYDVAGPAALPGLFGEEFDQLRGVSSRDVSVEVALSGGVEVLDLYGYTPHNGEITEGGFRVWLGDMAAGESRWVVARVGVDASMVGEWPVAEVTARYVGVEEPAASVVSASVWTTVSEDDAVAEVDLDGEVGAAVAQACRSATEQEAAAYWEEGELDAWRETYSSGLETLAALEGRYAMPDVEAQREALQEWSQGLEEADPASRSANRRREEAPRDKSATFEAMDATF